MKKLFWLIVFAVLFAFALAYVSNKYRVPQETPVPVVEERKDWRTPEQIYNEKWCEEENLKGNKVCKM